MATIKRRIALALALLMCVSFALTTLTACTGGGGDDQTDSTTTTTTTTPGSDDPDSNVGKTTHTVSIKTAGGMPLSGVTFYVYEGEDNLEAFGTTDANGNASVEVKSGKDYYVTLATGTLEGYNVESKYTFTDRHANIVISSSVITDNTGLGNVSYKVGDVIRDFSVLTSDGETFKLSEALKEKDAVLINFWYSTCSPCVTEFPYMQTVYERYADKLDIIALNPYAADNEDTVKLFKAEHNLTFNMAKDYSTLSQAFNLQGYPTSIMVDRYGVICLIEVGGLPSEKPFTAMFDHFTADNYEQKLLTSIDELTPTEVPNVEMPSSDEIASVIKKGDFEVTFTPETDPGSAEYSWPFVIGEKDGAPCIKTSNAFKDGSYATLYANITVTEEDFNNGKVVFAFDWFASTEVSVDILYVLIDKKDVYQISGVSEEWQTSYAYVALKPGTYELALCYLKDDTTDMGEDTVYLKNLQLTTISQIDEAYIPRYAATDRKEDGFGFNSYVEIFFNEEDGYYHVGSVDGPLLLVDLMGSTQFSETSVNLFGYNGQLIDPLTKYDYYTELVNYCNYAVNSTIYGYCPVNQRLRELLEATASLVGLEGVENEWLQTCLYYDAYGSESTQLPDPIKGLANFSAFEAIESTGKEDIPNYITYDRLIMPRGLKSKFTPTKSGVYRIQSDSEGQVLAWVFLEDGTQYFEYAIIERFVDDIINCDCYVYLEAGVDYYINIAFEDLYAIGTLSYTLRYVAPTMDLFRIAAPGYFTYEESINGEINDILALGIDVVLGKDGYYHEDLGNGKLGSIVYADFSLTTSVFPSSSILDIIEKGGFNFSLTENDQYILAFMATHGDGCEDYLKELWGDEFASYAELYQIYDVFDGVYHGKGEDLTPEIQKYVDKMISGNKDENLNGCVAVDEELAALLQTLMDKFTFEGVENSWLKLCYYYETIGG